MTGTQKSVSRIATILVATFFLAACATAGSSAKKKEEAEASPYTAQTVSNVDPEKSRALYIGLINTMAADGKHRAALAYLDDFDKRWPGDAEATALRADQHLALGETKEAALHYKKVMDSGLKDRAYAGYGRIAAALGEWPRAVSQLEKAHALRPSHVSYLNNLGYAYLKVGQNKKGLKLLERALELDPKNDAVRNNVILALARNKEKAKVMKALDLLSDKERTKVVKMIQNFRQNG